MSAACRGIHHVNIRVPADEIPALCKFYTEVVGLTIGARPPFRSPGVWLYAGADAVVHLSQLRADERIPPLTERGSGFNHVALACAGADAMIDRLQARGVPFRLTEVPLTHERQIFIRDPSGVGVELIFPLAEAS